MPKAPGTWGSLVALLFVPLWQLLPGWAYAVLLAAGLVFGVWLCGKVARDLGVHDHEGIVWDEFVGIWITFWLVPAGWHWLLAGFVLFRVMDILKPWPISWVDRHVDGGLGIMLDDILAGVAAWAVLQGLIVALADDCAAGRGRAALPDGRSCPCSDREMDDHAPRQPAVRLPAFTAASGCQSASSVQVVGLFPNAAVLNVDGQRKLVRVGGRGPGDVEVVSADARGAVLRVDGVERRYELSREYSGGYAAPARTQLSVAKGLGGHYWVAGSIDGQPVQFLVDTGATSVAINENQARRLGIDHRVDGKPMVVSTASGTAKAWRSI